MFVLEIIAFAYAWWLGLYLVVRDPARPLLRRAGLGLLAYALALAIGLLGSSAPIVLDAYLDRIHQLLTVLPALCWTGALLALLPEDLPLRAKLDRLWRVVVLPLAALLGIAAFLTDATPRFGQDGALQVGIAYIALIVLALLLLTTGLWLVARLREPSGQRKQLSLLLVAGLFFGLGTALAIGIPGMPGDNRVAAVGWLGISRTWGVLMIGIDLLLLGVAIAWMDAFDEGEALWPDLLRSLIGATLTALAFGAQVALVMVLGAGFDLMMRALLLASIATAIAVQTLGRPLQTLLDRVAFVGAPTLRQSRAELRDVAEALPRLDAASDLAALDASEFARLTRRAFSHYGDLAKLATSPLTRLPQISARLAARRANDDPIERATELKRLLSEAVARLKPHDSTAFASTDEWRLYNALFFPYIVGLKPYSRRATHTQLDPVAQEALAWFQQQVPERTLHHWQNAAARLIAEQLRGDTKTE